MPEDDLAHNFERHSRTACKGCSVSPKIMGSVGLLMPWATIRTIRYRVSHLNITLYGELDSFIAREKVKIEALGEEVTDLIDIDLGL